MAKERKSPKALYRVKLCSDGGRYGAVVRWDLGGRPHRKYFETEKKARTWADLQAIKAQNSGIGVLEMTDELRLEALKAAAIIEPFGRSLVEAAQFAAEHWRAASASMKVNEAVDALLAAKERDDRSARYRDDLKGRLAKFAKTFGDRKMSELTSGEIRQWINALPVGPTSRNNTRRVLSVLWTHGIEHDWCSENLIDRIGTANEGADKIGILTPQETARLLVGTPARSVALFAVGLFCGLRRSELERITPASIRLNSGLVEVSVRKTGVGRRFVRIRQNLRAWLLGCGPIQSLTTQQFRKDLAQAAERAGIESWPHNAMRHSFCSYALAHERNLNDLTLEMGHTSPHTLFAHYRELVTPEDAAAYWRMTPARARAMIKQLP